MRKPAVRDTSRSTEAYARAREKKMSRAQAEAPRSVRQPSEQKYELEYLERSDPAKAKRGRFKKAKKELLRQQRRPADPIMGRGERLRSQKE